MSKVVNTVAKVASIAALAVPGLQWVAVGLAVGSALLAPKAKQQARQAAQVALDIGETPREAIFGEAATGGTLADGFNYGGKYGTDWEVLTTVLADHRCEALTGFYVNDVYVTFAGNGAVAGYNGQLEVYWLPGTETQTLPTVLTAHGGWAASDNLAGISAVVVCYKADDAKAKHPVWTAGRPSFVWVVKGKRCYIARKDSTVPGGAGAHRWSDPSTWEWTDNPIDCRYNWVRGVFACDRTGQPDMLLVGRGLSAIEAPPQNTFAPANLCDEAVALAAGGSEKRYRISAVIKADDAFIDTEENFAAACAGVIVQPEGSVEIEPGAAKSPVAWITDADLVVGASVQFSDFRSRADDEWVNTVVPRHIEPAQRWGDHAAPIRRVIADVIADRGTREATLSLRFVRYGTQAQRCGEIRRRLGRLPRTAGITLGPRFAGIEEGDWIVWTSARRTGGVPVTFRVEAFAVNEKWQNTLQLREIAANVFAWSTADEVVDGAVTQQQAAPVTTGAPDATDWSLSTTVQQVGSTIVAQLIVDGAVGDPNADQVVFEIRVYDPGNGPGDNWGGASAEAPTITLKPITGIVPTADYEVAISYRVRGVIGDRLILGPIGVYSATIDTNRITADATYLTADRG